MNYKSFASYISGCVRQVLVKVIGDKRVLVPKLVNCCSFNSTVSCVCVGEPFNEDEPETPYSMGSCRRKWQDYGPLWLHGRAGWKLLTCAIPAVGSWVCIRDSIIVTEKKAYWVIPTAVKEVSYAPVPLINFGGSKGSLAKLTSPPIISIIRFTATICSCKGC